ncbi:hypothetical protein F383_21450 [Gossypium arboreum]|uniref:Uncharacterized protein n=1 Tax=Gossypium arboreum TaxID=29729 RepID=A0A0B0NY81_GOSAR|nr:hypothetical protein F383_21450 [Gossypium arboreum]
MTHARVSTRVDKYKAIFQAVLSPSQHMHAFLYKTYNKAYMGT